MKEQLIETARQLGVPPDLINLAEAFEKHSAGTGGAFLSSLLNVASDGTNRDAIRLAFARHLLRIAVKLPTRCAWGMQIQAAQEILEQVSVDAASFTIALFSAAGVMDPIGKLSSCAGDKVAECHWQLVFSTLLSMCDWIRNSDSSSRSGERLHDPVFRSEWENFRDGAGVRSLSYGVDAAALTTLLDQPVRPITDELFESVIVQIYAEVWEAFTTIAAMPMYRTD
jgi:hypothetical protein